MATMWDTPGSVAVQSGFGGFGSAPNPAYGGNPFFNPQSTYGAQQSWYNTPISGQIRENQLPLAFQAYGQQQGIGNTDTAFNQWFQQQQPRFQQAYGLATMQNPLITIDQFMRTLPQLQQLRAQFQSLSPEQRGENWRTYAPVARWIGR